MTARRGEKEEEEERRSVTRGERAYISEESSKREQSIFPLLRLSFFAREKVHICAYARDSVVYNASRVYDLFFVHPRGGGYYIATSKEREKVYRYNQFRRFARNLKEFSRIVARVGILVRALECSLTGDLVFPSDCE